ncbi:MAG: STAS domain-containing protein [Pseudonocardia sp.]|nr:STAS domain-containing protein [Pseudonocardia sp.]
MPLSPEPGHPPPDFRAVVEHHPRGVLVRVDGDIDSLGLARFDAALRTRTAGRPLIVDLTRVRFLGSVGMAALITARERTAADGAPLRLVVGDNRVVVRPMTITGLLSRFDVFTDVEHALDES